jgi:mono/diheme cytochrome c family protein
MRRIHPEALFFLGGCGRLITAATNLLPGDDRDEGRQLFSLSCAKCHDEDAQGDGPEHSTLVTPPSNLTLVRNTPDMNYSIVAKGIPGTEMPAHPYVPRGAFDKVALYLEGLPADTSQEWSHPWAIEIPGKLDPTFAHGLYVTACAGCHDLSGSGAGHGRPMTRAFGPNRPTSKPVMQCPAGSITSSPTGGPVR